MASLTGTAKGTLSGQQVTQPSELESLLQSGQALASRLLTLYTSPPEPADIDYSSFEKGMTEAINQRPAPTPVPVTPAPRGGALAAGLIATALADRSGRGGGQSNPQLVATVENRRQDAQQAERYNITTANAAALEKHAALLEVRKTILASKIEQEMANQKAAAADKAAKELFVVNTALDQINKELEHARSKEITGMQIAGQQDLARISGWINFLGRGGAAGEGAAGKITEEEGKELKSLMEFMTNIDLKIAEDGRSWWPGPNFGKTVMASEEEVASQLRTSGAYLSSPFPRVRATAEQAWNTVLAQRFGNDEQAKQRFLRQLDIQVLEE